jgi:hypothetical protein
MPNFDKIFKSPKLKEELIVERTGMNRSMLQNFEEFVLDSLRNCNSFFDVCTHIKYLVAKEYQGVWQCIVYKKFFANLIVEHSKSKYVLFSISDLRIFIFGSD